MLLRSIPAIIFLTALSGCNFIKRTPVDPATLQTAATEAVLRYTIEHCPRRKEAKLAVIAIGEYMSEPTPEFVNRFKDVPGLEFIDFKRPVAGMKKGKSRRFDEQTQENVLELQIGSITEAKDGKQEAVAAWAFEDDAGRKRLEVKEKAGGGYEIRELENIPVPNRNDDRSAPGK